MRSLRLTEARGRRGEARCRRNRFRARAFCTRIVRQIPELFDMNVLRIPVSPFAGQRPGTSGLRKRVAEFREPGYVETFVQSLFDALPDVMGQGATGQTLVLGGDGRFFNDRAIQTIIRIAAANGVFRLIVGRGGLLSTPATSALIRERKALGGIVLSASH